MQGKPVIRLYLFGSYARGEAHSKSDIDLLAEFDYGELNKTYDYFDIKFAVEDQLQKKVDLVSAKMVNKSGMSSLIEQDKTLIYERE